MLLEASVVIAMLAALARKLKCEQPDKPGPTPGPTPGPGPGAHDKGPAWPIVATPKDAPHTFDDSAESAKAYGHLNRAFAYPAGTVLEQTVYPDGHKTQYVVGKRGPASSDTVVEIWHDGVLYTAIKDMPKGKRWRAAKKLSASEVATARSLLSAASGKAVGDVLQQDGDTQYRAAKHGSKTAVEVWRYA